MKNILEKLRMYGVKKFLSFGWHEFISWFRKVFMASYSQKDEDLVIDRILGYKKMVFMLILAPMILRGLATQKGFI